MKKAMDDVGIYVSSHTSNLMSDYKEFYFDYVITVCNHARDNCPYFKNTSKTISYSFDDPADANGTYEEQLRVYKKVRDQIRQFCLDFCEEEFTK